MAYVTDSLRLSPQGMYLSNQWADIALKDGAKRDDRSADEIVDDVLSRFEDGPK